MPGKISLVLQAETAFGEPFMLCRGPWSLQVAEAAWKGWDQRVALAAEVSKHCQACF